MPKAVRTLTTSAFRVPKVFALTRKRRAPVRPDADLIALGERFDALKAEYDVRLAAEKELEGAIVAADAELGPLYRSGAITSEEAMARRYRVEVESGWGAASRVTDAADERLHPILEAIDEAPVHTLAGLIVKAKVADFVWGETVRRKSPVDRNWGEDAAVRLIDALLRLEGARHGSPSLRPHSAL